MEIYPAEISTFPDFLQKVWFNIYLATTYSVHLLWTRHGSKYLATEFSWWFYKVRTIPILLIIRMRYEFSGGAEYEPRQFLDSRLLTDKLDSVQPTLVDVSETACFPDMAVDYASCGFFLARNTDGGRRWSCCDLLAIK